MNTTYTTLAANFGFSTFSNLQAKRIGITEGRIVTLLASGKAVCVKAHSVGTTVPLVTYRLLG